MAQMNDSLRGGGKIRGNVQVNSRSASAVTLEVNGYSGQTADLFKVKNSSGVTMFSVDVSGNIIVNGTVTEMATETGNALVLSGTLSVGGASTLTGNVTAGANLSVAGTSSFAGAAVFNNNLNVNNNLAVQGLTTLNGTVTVNGAGLVTADSVTTFTNKTLTAPKFANAGFIADANGNELMIFTTTASAVNEVTLANGATGVGPTFTASGETNVDINFQVKGTGVYNFKATASGPTDLRLFEDADNGSNYASIIAPSSLGGNVVLTLPAATDTLVGKATTDSFTNKSIGAGTLLLEENASIGLDPAGSADGKYTGITVTATAGYTQAFGDLVYLDPTDSRWEATDASAAAGADGDTRGILGMVVSAGTDGNACTVLLHGIIRADAKFPTFTVNSPLYASATSGLVTHTAPTTTDYVVRVVGYAITTDEMLFAPASGFQTAV